MFKFSERIFRGIPGAMMDAGIILVLISIIVWVLDGGKHVSEVALAVFLVFGVFFIAAGAALEMVAERGGMATIVSKALVILGAGLTMAVLAAGWIGPSFEEGQFDWPLFFIGAIGLGLIAIGWAVSPAEGQPKG